MQVNFTFRHFEPSDAIKSFARDKVEHLRKYLDNAGEASIVLSIEKHLHHAEILVHSGPFFLRGREKTDDMYASIGAAIDKIETQIKRYKGRMRQYKPAGHHGRDAVRVRQRIIEAESAAVEAGLEESVAEATPSKVVDTKELVAKRMTVDEAVLQLELIENDFLVFTNEETGHVAVMYRRKDQGSYGLIDARAAE